MVRDYSSCAENQDYWEGKDPAVAAGMRLLTEAWKKDEGLVMSAIALEQERVTSLSGFGTACEFFFVDEVTFDPKAVEKWKGQEHVPKMLSAFLEFFSGKSSVSTSECESLLRQFQESSGFDKLGPIVHPVRVALSGSTVGPGLFELMAVLGPERIVRRLERAKEVLA
jgi:glutamyl/glutaminyl-tRNA synthetase